MGRLVRSVLVGNLYSRFLLGHCNWKEHLVTEDEEMLASIREVIPDAKLEDYIMSGGQIFVRCRVCRKNPIPIYGCVLWCDACIDEYLNEPEPERMHQFVARKKEGRQ